MYQKGAKHAIDAYGDIAAAGSGKAREEGGSILDRSIPRGEEGAGGSRAGANSAGGAQKT